MFDEFVFKYFLQSFLKNIEKFILFTSVENITFLIDCYILYIFSLLENITKNKNKNFVN